MTKTIEDRVAELERRIEELTSDRPKDNAWWRHVWGAFQGDPAFAEAMRLGREYRESLRGEDDPADDTVRH